MGAIHKDLGLDDGRKAVHLAGGGVTSKGVRSLVDGSLARTPIYKQEYFVVRQMTPIVLQRNAPPILTTALHLAKRAPAA